MSNTTINQLRVLQKADEALYGYFYTKFQKHFDRLGQEKMANFSRDLGQKKEEVEDTCQMKSRKSKKTKLIKYKSK